jgi:hypothetical protein
MPRPCNGMMPVPAPTIAAVYGAEATNAIIP